MADVDRDQLVQQAKAGDQEAAAALVKSYHSSLKRLIREKAGEDADYKKLEVKAFTYVFAHMDSVQTAEDFQEAVEAYVISRLVVGDTPAGMPAVPNVSASSEEKQTKDSGSSPTAEIPSFPHEESVKGVPLTSLDEVRKEASYSSGDADTEIPFHLDERSTQGEQPGLYTQIMAGQSPAQAEPEPVRPAAPAEETRPRKPKRTRQEEEYEDDEEEEERSGVPGWLVGLLTVVLALVALVLILYIFVPSVYDSTFGKLPFMPASGVSEETAATASAEPTATLEATATAAPTAAAEATATAEATASTSTGLTVIGQATVNVSGLNIRTSATTSASTDGQAVSGTTYDVYATASADGYTWYQIGENQWIANNGTWVTYTEN